MVDDVWKEKNKTSLVQNVLREDRSVYARALYTIASIRTTNRLLSRAHCYNNYRPRSPYCITLVRYLYQLFATFLRIGPPQRSENIVSTIKLDFLWPRVYARSDSARCIADYIRYLWYYFPPIEIGCFMFIIKT